jgi:hypothetical protein
MAFAISEFKSNLKGGGAKSALFSVNLNYPTGVSAPAVYQQAQSHRMTYFITENQ